MAAKRLPVSNATINEHAARTEAVAPELARQARQARHKPSDGGIHMVDRDVAKSRTAEADEATEVARPPVRRWMKASSLPSFPAPPGFYLEWVRRDNSQRGDSANLVEHLTEGCDFARKSDFPGRHVSTQTLPDHGQCIGNASSVLMKLPLELKQQRDEFYRTQRNRATAAVGMPDPSPEGVSHPDMPIVEDVNKTRAVHRQAKARRAPVRLAE
jgi:hypothetical protein